jgi:ABC-2 type transport system permease protein
VANFIFAFLAAQLLYGDLYNSRMCNAIHALPLRRESWFVTNLASGFSFSLIPTAAALLFSLLMILLGAGCCDNGLLIPVMVFIGANVQYIFFFGLATLSAFLVGSRFALAVVYAIINFASMIAYWLVDTLYTPMLYGIKTVMEPFILFSPVVQMCSAEYMDVEWLKTEIISESRAYSSRGIMHLTDGWGYIAICAALGIGLLGLALMLYRRRKLECAGDFMAVKGMEPVFLTVYTLVVGCVFQMIFGTFTGNDIGFSLFVGLFVGFFTGRMLLKRTVRVFQWKAWGKCGILIGIFLLTLLITKLDPLGIQTWIPNADNVTSIQVHASHSPYPNSGETFTVEDGEDIEKMLYVHGLLIDGDAVEDIVLYPETTVVSDKSTPAERYPFPVSLTYTLKNGRTVSRYYYVTIKSEAGQILRPYFSSLSCVLGVEVDQLEELVQKLGVIHIDGELVYLAEQDQLELLQAIAADCESGSMIQIWSYRRSEGLTDDVFYIELTYKDGFHWCHIQVNENCENVLRYMEEHNIETPNYDEKFG